MEERKNKKLIKFFRGFLLLIKPKFSFHYIAYLVLFLVISFSTIQLIKSVSAVTPNPGHPWSELGDGVFVFSNGQTTTPYTYTFPAATTTVLTTNSLVSVAQGGTGLGSIASGSVLGANSANALSAITSTSGTKILTNTEGTITWENPASGMVYPGVGIPVSTGSTWGASITDNSSNWDSAYTYRLTSASGTSPLTLTLLNNSLTGSISQATTSASGYLSSTDWNTFNSKQVALVSGTNIKTINSTTLLGSGDISLQTPLTAGVDYLTPTAISNAYVPYTGATGAVALGANTLSTTSGIITPKIYPASDSTTAFQINKADGTTNVLNVDTTNSRVGIGTTSPGELLSLGLAGTKAGVLSLAGATSGKAIIQVSAVAGTPTLTLPTSTGTLALTSDIPLASPITIVNSTSLFSTGLSGTGVNSIATDSIFLGESTGYDAVNASNSIFLGKSSGSGATNALQSNFIGLGAGIDSAEASYSNFIGSEAGLTSVYGNYSNFIGYQAGKSATYASNSIFLGTNAGLSDTVDNVSHGSDYWSILIGYNTNTGGYNNSILLGGSDTTSPISNTKSNQFMLADMITDVRWRGVEYELPSSQGGSGYFLRNDGTGVLSWGAPTASVAWDVIGDPTGNGSIAMGSTVQTMDWATATTQNALSLTGASLTTGKLLSLTSNSLTSGTLLDITSAGTAGLTNQKGLNIALSGTNATSAQTTYGAYISNTHAGTTSTNVGLYASATGGTTANYAAQLNGDLSFTAGATRTISVLSGTTQSDLNLKAGDNTVGNAGSVFIEAGNGWDSGGGVYIQTGTGLPIGEFAISSGSTRSLTILPNGNLNIGTDTSPDNLFTVGSSSQFQVNSSGAIAATTGYTQGSGTMSLTSANTTQTTTSSAFRGNFNSLTTGTGMYLASSSLTSGTLLDIVSAGTAGLTNQKGLNIALSGTNATSAQTTYGAYISNTHAGTTSTNVGLYVTASGGTTANYAAIFDAGNVGIGTTTATLGHLQITDTGTSVSRGLTVSQHNSGVQGSLFNFYKSRGTESSPLTVANGDYGGVFIFKNHDGTAYRSNATWGYKTNGTISTNSIPGQLFFAVSQANDDNPYTNGSVRMVIGSDGKVGIGDTSPDGTLDIDSSITTGIDFGITNTGIYTGTGLLSVVANSATTGTVGVMTANGLSSGTILSLTSAGTAGLTNQKGLNIALSGTNATSAQTTYGAYISNTHAGTTSTNVGLYVTASGGTTANYAAIFDAGNVGIGTTAPTTALQIVGTATLPTVQGTTGSGGDLALRGNGANLTSGRVKVLTQTASTSSSTGAFTVAGGVGITGAVYLGGTTANTFAMERNTTVATAGQGLTLSSGGAIAGTADLAGGDLSLKSGISTGTGSSAIRFFTATAGTTGTTDNTPTEKMTILGSGDVGISFTTPKSTIPNSFNGVAQDRVIEIRSENGSGDSGVFIRRSDAVTGLDLWQESGGNGQAYIDSRFNSDVGGLTFRVKSAASTPLTALRILGSGLIGVGTVSPSTILEIGSSNLGDGVAGPVITLGRNTNATNTGAGSINFLQKGGTAGYVWQDAAGNMRINTVAPSNANDTSGTVIGAQGSVRDTKQDIEDYTDYNNAFNMVVNAPLHTFRYIKEVNGYGADSPLAKVRIGYIADEVDPVFMVGNSIDQVSVNGILMASIKEMNLKFTEINNFEKENTWRDSLTAWLANAENRITRIFTGEVCLTEAGEETVCLNRQELKSLKELLNQTNNNTGGGNGGGNNSVVCNSPQILVNNVCVDPTGEDTTCSDGIKNQDETDIDIGGVCDTSEGGTNETEVKISPDPDVSGDPSSNETVEADVITPVETVTESTN